MTRRKLVVIASAAFVSLALLGAGAWFFGSVEKPCVSLPAEFENAIKLKGIADAAARRAEAEKTERAREEAVAAAKRYEEAAVEARKVADSMKTKSPAGKDMRASLWKSCSG